MFVSCVCCGLFRYRPRLQDEHSFIGALPGVCVCLVVCGIKTSTLRGLNPFGAVEPQEKNINRRITDKSCTLP